MPSPDPGSSGWTQDEDEPLPIKPDPRKPRRRPKVVSADDEIVWDPYLQRWIRRKKVVVDDGSGTQETYYFKKSYVDFPINYSGPNHFNAPPEGEKPIMEEGGTSTPESAKGDDSYFMDEDSFWQDPREVLLEHQPYSPVTFTASGYPLESSKVPNGQYGVQYSWDGTAYAVNTAGGAPVTVVTAGSIISGSQLNVITGTNNYNPDDMYMVTAVHGLYYVDEHGRTRTYDGLMDSTFFNRNKGNGSPEWVPGNVFLSVDAINTDNLVDNQVSEDDYMSEDQSEAAEMAGLSDWHFSPSPGGEPPVVSQPQEQQPPIGTVNPFWVPPVDLSGLTGPDQQG